ncbi:MAG: SCO family protein [Pyrinomonadaceae bacterium]
MTFKFNRSIISNMRHVIFCLLVIALLSACKSADSASNGAESAKRYPLSGKVVSVDKANKKAEIDHDAVEGYMAAMTMSFPIHADWVWDELKPGADIRAELVVDNTAKDPYWLENIGIVAAPDPNQPPPPIKENVAQVGKEAPDFTLTNQDGRKVTLKGFRGHPLAITFIYARCPLPDYCIRMSTNFSDLANQLSVDPELKEKIRLLSISFDPDNDTPGKLRSYGLGYLGVGAKPDFTIWQLAVGSDAEVRKIADFYGLRYEVDPDNKTLINHSLRTAVITPDGKVARILTGPEWTPADLLKELKATMGNSPT